MKQIKYHSPTQGAPPYQPGGCARGQVSLRRYRDGGTDVQCARVWMGVSSADELQCEDLSFSSAASFAIFDRRSIVANSVAIGKADIAFESIGTASKPSTSINRAEVKEDIRSSYGQKLGLSPIWTYHQSSLASAFITGPANAVTPSTIAKIEGDAKAGSRIRSRVAACLQKEEWNNRPVTSSEFYNMAHLAAAMLAPEGNTDNTANPIVVKRATFAALLAAKEDPSTFSSIHRIFGDGGGIGLWQALFGLVWGSEKNGNAAVLERLQFDPKLQTRVEALAQFKMSDGAFVVDPTPYPREVMDFSLDLEDMVGDVSIFDTKFGSRRRLGVCLLHPVDVCATWMSLGRCQMRRASTGDTLTVELLDGDFTKKIGDRTIVSFERLFRCNKDERRKALARLSDVEVPVSTLGADYAARAEWITLSTLYALCVSSLAVIPYMQLLVLNDTQFRATLEAGAEVEDVVALVHCSIQQHMGGYTAEQGAQYAEKLCAKCREITSSVVGAVPVLSFVDRLSDRHFASPNFLYSSCELRYDENLNPVFSIYKRHIKDEAVRDLWRDAHELETGRWLSVQTLGAGLSTTVAAYNWMMRMSKASEIIQTYVDRVIAVLERHHLAHRSLSPLISDHYVDTLPLGEVTVFARSPFRVLEGRLVCAIIDARLCAISADTHATSTYLMFHGLNLRMPLSFKNIHIQ